MLTEQVRKLSKKPESSAPGIKIGPREVWVPFDGKEQPEGSGLLAEWNIPAYAFAKIIKPEFSNKTNATAFPSLQFVHVTQRRFVTGDEGIKNRALQATGVDKEFGPGFYTMCARTALANGDAYVLGEEWFTKKQQKNKWCVLSFEVSKNHWQALLLEAAERYAGALWHYLTQPKGYPKGGDQPNKEDLDAIEFINKRGHVLIFPDDADAEVAVSSSKRMSAYEVQASQGLKLPGDPWIVIAPQKPEYLSARQIVFRDGIGLWLINSAARSLVYNNSL
jgi:hypothetical protein